MKICGKIYTKLIDAENRYNELKLDYAEITDILTQMKVKGCGPLSKREFDKQRTATIRQRTIIEKELRAYKVAVKSHRNGNNVSGVGMEVKRLIAEYEEFSKDRTRVASLRVMAAEIAGKLRGALSKSNLVEIDY